jgi:hypothetical protein
LEHFSKHYFLTSQKATPQYLNNIYYTLRFTSLIAPCLLPTYVRPSAAKSNPKILLKQSYVIFTWFYYLRQVIGRGKRRETHLVKFAFLPSTSRTYTLTKAPMAHKTNSKEQFVLKNFHFCITFKAVVPRSFTPHSVHQAFLAARLIQNQFPVFETNLLFLKSYKLSLGLSDSHYFQY